MLEGVRSDRIMRSSKLCSKSSFDLKHYEELLDIFRPKNLVSIFIYLFFRLINKMNILKAPTKVAQKDIGRIQRELEKQRKGQQKPMIPSRQT